MTRRPARARPAPPVTLDHTRLREAVEDLLEQALAFVSLGRIEVAARAMFPRSEPNPLPGSSELDWDDALDMATQLALFTPSARGHTAFDRLAAKHSAMSQAQAAALALIRTSTVRLIRIEGGRDGTDTAPVHDIVTDEPLRLLDPDIDDEMRGVAVMARLARLPDTRHFMFGPVLPLDSAALALARSQNPEGPISLKATESLYRHAMRHGAPLVEGLNRAFAPPEPEPGEPSSNPDQPTHPL